MSIYFNKEVKVFSFILYYHIYLPRLIWNSSAHRKRAPGRRGIVCAQGRPNWVAVGPVSTPLLRIFGPNTAGGSPARFNQKGPLHSSLSFFSSQTKHSVNVFILRILIIIFFFGFLWEDNVIGKEWSHGKLLIRWYLTCQAFHSL